jgi:AraC family transcriptional regulator of adaptative response/methylated-DNA-[protein]-cysteine methyltransferase
MSSSDYARVEQAIRFLDANARRQPSLADVAAHVGLSEAHFQRLFTRWAGVSPKRFVQFQTVEHAKRLLRESRSVLDASWDAGLSGGGRLHDLFVAAEALTPGEYKQGGAGLEIAWGVHPTPFGDAFLAVTPRGVCALSFLPESEERRAAVERAAAELAEEWPEATLRADASATRPQAARAFAPLSESRLARHDEPAPLGVVLKGTNFQLKVWRALLQVPAGAVTTYEELAAAAGAPNAVRAVGSAVARNAIAYLIPCHRVIRKTGAFGQYRWGPDRKRAMLVWESERAAALAS